MYIAIAVTSPDGIFSFTGRIDIAFTPDEMHLPPAFYQKCAGNVPPSPHHEVVITQPAPDELRNHRLHLEQSRKGDQPVMCYPQHIPTVADACNIFSIWCLGTVLTMTDGIDLNTAYSECGGDHEKFRHLMEEKHSISILQERAFY